MTVSFVAIRFDYSDFDLASACAIGLVKVQNGKPTDSLYRAFMPNDDGFIFVDDAGQTGGLRMADIEALEGFETLWPEVDKFIGDLPLVANSAHTYMKTLEILWSEFGQFVPPRPFLCTQVIGRRITDLGSFNLDYFAHSFGYEMPETPTALDKATATAVIALGLVETAGVASLDALTEKAKVSWGSVSSEARVSCHYIGHYGDNVSKADLEAMREKYAKAGFDESHPFFEKHIVLTGTLRKGKREELDALIAQVGGFPELGFTKKTNYLVVGYDRIDGLNPGGKPTGKISKSIEARGKGQLVEVLDEQTFLDLLEG